MSGWFVMEVHYVFCEVAKQFLNFIQTELQDVSLERTRLLQLLSYASAVRLVTTAVRLVRTAVTVVTTAVS
jgi:hypothetical protein